MGEFLFPWRKRTKTPLGVSRGRLTAPAGPPPVPRLRGIPLHPSAEVPARRIRFPVLIFPGRWALVRRKISVGAFSLPRLVPTSRGRGCGIVSAPDGTLPMSWGRASLGLAPTAFSGPRLVPEGQARFHGCGGHRITHDRNCPVGAGLRPACRFSEQVRSTLRVSPKGRNPCEARRAESSRPTGSWSTEDGLPHGAAVPMKRRERELVPPWQR